MLSGLIGDVFKRPRRRGVTVPLHISQDDMSSQSCRHRLEHYRAMYALNPKGFRTAKTKHKGSGKAARSYRINTIVTYAQYGS